MTDVAALLAALQHGDSQFPGGGFAFSWGLEGLVAEGMVGRRDLKRFVEGQFRQRWVSFERVVIALAHGSADDMGALIELDDRVDAATVAAPAREGSKRAGRALLGIHAKLDTSGASTFRAEVLAERAHGHAAVVQGLVLAGTGLPRDDALTVAAYVMAASFCTAAVRLGLASHLDGQKALGELRPVIAGLVAQPLPLLDGITSFAPAAEIAMMRHAEQDLRLFSN